jgi:hypothetical protein
MALHETHNFHILCSDLVAADRSFQARRATARVSAVEGLRIGGRCNASIKSRRAAPKAFRKIGGSVGGRMRASIGKFSKTASSSFLEIVYL